jgi:cytochrome b
MTTNEKTVWDLGVRVFHWSLVACFAGSYLTGEENTELHSYLGYTIIGLLCFRILWGFVGTQHARFADFIYSPDRIISYCKSLAQGNAEHYDGHNPAGGLMIIVMLLCLMATTYTGLKAYGVEGHGPLADNTTLGTVTLVPSAYADHDDDDDDDDEYDRHHDRAGVAARKLSHRDEGDEEDDEEEFWEEIHEVFVNLMILLIIIHIAAVVVSSRLHGENLVRAMITGKKTTP